MVRFFERAKSILRGHFFTLGAERTDFDCLICGEPCDPAAGGTAGTFTHQEGGLPKLYSHGMCMKAYTGPQLHAAYLREIGRRFSMGRQPHMLRS